MKKQWIAVALSAGLSQMAMATTYKVDFEGSLIIGSKTVDCPQESSDCDGFVQDLNVQRQPFSMSFTFEIGASPGRSNLFTSHVASTDPISGRGVDSWSATQRYANWATGDAKASQVPALPSASPNPFDGAAGVTHQVFTSATRSRNVRVWSDTQQVIRSSEGWGLSSSELWLDASGAGYQTYVTLSGSTPFSGGTVDNHDDLEPLSYYLDMLKQGTTCLTCVQLQWFDTLYSTDGLYSGVRIDGSGRLVSITEITAAVPEPSTYALMLAGVAAVGFAARRRRAAGAIKS
ncbi:PEP-CTERM sorting domain-containing protein [Roseateles sp. L2-2]|uniref:PEP-CTERM sorting domain-containing protein n=1 Tax=Roseateles TaxID=93681 RepID=UPI003D366A86